MLYLPQDKVGRCFFLRQDEIQFGRNLRILRINNNLSQQDLADAIRVTRQTLSAWERGVGKPDIYCVHDVCKILDVSIETILYKNLSEEKNFQDYEEPFEYGYCYIENISKQGFYTIIDEDLEEFFGIIRHDMEHISVTALALRKRGYIITEVFNNGFSIYLQNSEEANCLKKDLYDIFDYFIHHDNLYIEKRREEVGDIIGKAHEQVLDNVMTEIYGAEINSLAYYWIDDEENVRGYANTEEECRVQAEFQKCVDYRIISLT